MIYHFWLGAEDPYTVTVSRIPTQRQREAGMAVIRKRCVNAFVQDEIYTAMVRAR